ncbi:glycosyltransferase involved in cell wall biosynthesis [Catalinimonas alkaloidigena]|uniref:glycosyltransferase n=1 Tax=Catalinimonas alkaloidigena TaxID=1075417 RepID=UPI0024075255|nr:glycosyltransferase [Catalinimonas alkaloidigena]MDF9799667.1 glycosyltransferase involved in cell wall biosynthesis [Catalinimonas alkaloidigena]
MKILLSAYSCAPDAGSEPSCGWNWAVQLAGLGNQVWCFTAQSNKQVILNKLKTHPVENLRFIFIELPYWLEKTKASQFFPLAYMHYLIWQYYAYKVAKAKHASIGFDIVHHVTFGSIQLGSHMWKLPVPFVFGPVGGGEKIPQTLEKYSSSGALRDNLRSFMSFVIMNIFKSTNATSQASLVLATSCDTADVAKRLDAKNVKLFLDCGVSAGFMPEITPKREVKNYIDVLWVGRLLPQKGLDLVLDVFKRLGKNHNIRLTVVGEGPMGDEYKKNVKKNDLEDIVSFVGTLEYSELREYYLSHHILMFCPLRNAFGIQILEAMACGLPVITLDQHGAGTLIPEGVCIKVNPNDDSLIDRLKEALIKLAKNKRYRNQLSSNGLEYAKENSWLKKAQTMTSEYEKLSVKRERVSEKKLRIH